MPCRAKALSAASRLVLVSIENWNYKQNPRDEQAPKTGKVVNDHNKVGEQAVTQKDEAKRTPDSRADREAHVGGGNQTQARKGNSGAKTGH